MSLAQQLQEAVKRPSKKKLEVAIRDMRLLLGGRRARMRIRDEERLQSRVKKHVDDIVQITGMDPTDVWNQLENEARSRGAMTPLPGKDI